MKCLATVSFPQDVQHQKYQGVVWDIAIYRVPSNTGKWRFGWEFPNLNMWCLASCEGGDNRQPSVKMPSLTAVFSDTSAVFGGTFTEAASGDFKGLSAGWGLFLLPRTPKKNHRPSLMTKKRALSTNFGLEARNYCPLCLTALHFWILFFGKSIFVHHIIAKASRSAWRRFTLRTKWEYRGGLGERGWNKHQRSILWEVGCHKWPFCSLYTTRQFWPGACLILRRSWWGTATKHCCMGCFCLLKKVIHRAFFELCLAIFQWSRMTNIWKEPVKTCCRRPLLYAILYFYESQPVRQAKFPPLRTKWE